MKTKIQDLGRTMIEMISVLAILGVLTILGLQGYKTMILKVNATAAWDSALAFVNEMRHYEARKPYDKCGFASGFNWYCSGDSSVCSSWCPMDYKELLPSFANGSHSNFFVLVRKTNFTEVQFRKIRIDGLCKTLLPGGKLSGTSYWYQAIDGVTYKCYRADASVKW